ncbi:hypothetical protein [Sphingomonas sp.]|uniref:hypothetical protein n=1 Tax=Sphingomonas sp. TaxID=28214 RepID=UPI0035BC2E08
MTAPVRPGVPPHAGWEGPLRTLAGVSTCAALLGCSNPDATAPPVDVNAAAARAQDDIANYAVARGQRPASKAKVAAGQSR